MLKTAGYFISTLSVFLLGLVSWKATETEPDLRIYLVAGMAASVLGMLCRWLSYQLQEKHHEADSARTMSATRMSNEGTIR